MEKQEKHKELLLRSGAFFKQNGIKGPTMDDVARHLRISKKTLYKFVRDKRDLVRRSMDALLEADRQEIRNILKKDLNAIDKVYLINMKVGLKLKSLQPSVMYDLQHYFPEAAMAIDNQREHFIYKIIKQIHEQGIREGLFRENLNVEILARINVILIRSMFDPKQFPVEQYSFFDVHKEISKYHLRGIVSPEGEAYIKVLVDKIKRDEL